MCAHTVIDKIGQFLYLPPAFTSTFLFYLSISIFDDYIITPLYAHRPYTSSNRDFQSNPWCMKTVTRAFWPLSATALDFMALLNYFFRT